MKKTLHIIMIAAFTFLLAACTTQKKKEDLSRLGKAYHNMTSKYNGYFNANVLLTESIAKLNEQHVDNYNKTLDVFKYVAADNPKAVAEDLDTAIEKVSVVASLHRGSDWMDDCYLLLAKAQYVKQDYESAEESLLFMTEEYSPEAMASKERAKKKRKKKGKKGSSAKKSKSKKKKNKEIKKKKKKKKKRKKKKKKSSKKKKNSGAKKKSSTKKEPAKDKGKPKDKAKPEPTFVSTPKEPSNYFLKHRPAYKEAQLWLARVWIERDEADQAEAILDQLEKDPKVSKTVKREIPPVKAYLHIKNKEYAEAIPPLEEAIERSNKKADKARYAYIIGQLHQQADQGDKAYASFKKVLKYKPEYIMEFSARLKMAQNAWVNGKASADDAKKTLNKMLKDSKNADYKDQIYFALADIALKNDEKKEAIKNLELSLKYAQSNKAQKAESYLLLAQLYFDDERYVNAKNYYDSTLQVLNNTDERYDEVKNYSASLTEIADNITLIGLQDSLLAINDMSDQDKRALAQKISDEMKAQNKQVVTLGKPKQPVSRPSFAMGKSSFFAYDPRMLAKGKNEFKKKFGVRKLQDNWRRAQKQTISELDEESFTSYEEESGLSAEEMAEILRDVPSTPEAIAEANKKIEDALFALGGLYRDKLKREDKTIETLEGELLNRYPDTEHQLDSWYFLYLSHDKLGNKPQAKVYYDKIVGKYPDSQYARALQDPNFVLSSNEALGKLNKFYDQTYLLFDQGKYKVVVDRLQKSEKDFGVGHVLQPKFALLTAMCTGNLKGKEDYIVALKDVIANHPDTQEETRAREIIRILGGKIDKGIGTDDKDKDGIKKEEDSIFQLQDDKVHYIIVVLDGKSMSLNDAKIAVSDYNRQYHKLDRLKISNIYLGADTNTPILVIRRFKKKDKAMDYYGGVMKNTKDFLGTNKANFEIFAVNQYNYRQILKSKSAEAYRTFFKDNYLE